jgi:siroheme synthase-like protein
MPEFLGLNQLYPVFLKLETLQTLIVGGGNAATEKLSFMIKNSPNAQVTIVAPSVTRQIEKIAQEKVNVILHQRDFNENDLENKDIVIVATDNRILNKTIRDAAKSRKILVNVADTPELCDFYLGSVVTKGDLKIAISTNGKSPTFSKRFREVLEETLPDELPQLLLDLHKIRENLKTGFAEKVKRLSELTAILVNGDNT